MDLNRHMYTRPSSKNVATSSSGKENISTDKEVNDAGQAADK
jgi:hypothetical protein